MHRFWPFIARDEQSTGFHSSNPVRVCERDFRLLDYVGPPEAIRALIELEVAGREEARLQAEEARLAARTAHRQNRIIIFISALILFAAFIALLRA